MDSRRRIISFEFLRFFGFIWNFLVLVIFRRFFSYWCRRCSFVFYRISWFWVLFRSIFSLFLFEGRGLGWVRFLI